jgi:hypothetical protein
MAERDSRVVAVLFKSHPPPLHNNNKKKDGKKPRALGLMLYSWVRRRRRIKIKKYKRKNTRRKEIESKRGGGQVPIWLTQQMRVFLQAI